MTRIVARFLLREIVACLFLSLFVLPLVRAETSHVEHTLLRRLAVFPVKTEKSMASAAEEAWWQMREILTENKRFLIASKNFLQKKDVFQARAALSPADAIILGQLLDAQALMTTYVEDRTLTMTVYEGEYGRVLWSQQMQLHPSIPVARQLTGACKKLILDFIASIPYQGFVVVDHLIGQPVYEREGRIFLKADVGLNTEAAVGDEVQIVRISTDRLVPLFNESAHIEVIADGRITEVNREVVTIEVFRMTKKEDIKELSLVRLPKEFKRLRESFALKDNLKKKIDPEYFSPELAPVTQEAREFQPLVASLTFIVNLAAFLLLAF